MDQACNEFFLCHFVPNSIDSNSEVSRKLVTVLSKNIDALHFRLTAIINIKFVIIQINSKNTSQPNKCNLSIKQMQSIAKNASHRPNKCNPS